MIYRVFHPTPALSDVVDHYWYVRAQPGEIPDKQHFYTPLMQALVFNFIQQEEYHALPEGSFKLNKPAYLFGQGTGPRTATSNGVDYLGVKFKPLGIARVTGINMAHIANQIIDVDDIWCNELDLLWDEMQSAPMLESSITVLEHFLLDKYQRLKFDHKISAAQYAIRLINQNKGNIDIKALREQTYTSRKTLERSFIHALGISAKLYTRIVRFNAAKEKMDAIVQSMSLTDVALESGFYDSSHFIAEFKAFSGVTPTGYLQKTEKDFILKDH